MSKHREPDEQCSICLQNYYFCSHLEDSTPEHPLRCCKTCYDKHFQATGEGVPTYNSIISNTKLSSKYYKLLEEYLLILKKMSKYYNISPTKLLDYVLILEDYYSKLLLNVMRSSYTNTSCSNYISWHSLVLTNIIKDILEPELSILSNTNITNTETKVREFDRMYKKTIKQ